MNSYNVNTLCSNSDYHTGQQAPKMSRSITNEISNTTIILKLHVIRFYGFSIRSNDKFIGFRQIKL